MAIVETFATGFYNKLKGDANLQTKLGGSGTNYHIYNTVAPQSATYPYITFGVLTDVPVGTFESPSIIEDMTFYANVFSQTGIENLMEIVDLICAAMDNSALTITGYTAMKCVREYIGSVLFDDDNKVYQIPLRYRVQGSL
jgi:hypothetical protein